MSNNYYAGNVIYNNQHKELTIQGNLSEKGGQGAAATKHKKCP